MSETTTLCEDSSCTRAREAQCSNHCPLALCSEHLKEHENSFVIQYENQLNALHQLLSECLENLEESKTTVESTYQRDLLKVNEHYNNQLNLLDDKSLLIHSSENFIKRKLQLLLNVKNARAVLHQYDLEQVQVYRAKLNEHHPEETEPTPEDEEDEQSDFEGDVSEDVGSLDPMGRDEMQRCRGQCPLTEFGVFGLTKAHGVRLCTEERAKTSLVLLAHFHRYHHLTWALAAKLTKLTKNNFDPWKTKLFEANVDPIDPRFRPIPCPMNDIEHYHRKESFCHRKFHRESMKQHLINFHHLSLATANKVMNAVKWKKDFKEIDFD